MIALMMITGALIWLNVTRENKTEYWTIQYEMANRNIEWTGAGYSGINAR